MKSFYLSHLMFTSNYWLFTLLGLQPGKYTGLIGISLNCYQCTRSILGFIDAFEH